MSWWSSLTVVSTISTIAQWVVAVAGIVALVFSLRAATLQDRVGAAERARLGHDLTAARARADEAVARQEPRVLTNEQQAMLRAKLRSSVDTGLAEVPLIVATRLMDEESLGFGRQIAAAVQDSGWTLGWTEMSTHSFGGVAVFYHPDGVISPSCVAVQDAFGAAGIAFDKNHLDVKRTPIQRDDAVYVIVGHK